MSTINAYQLEIRDLRAELTRVRAERDALALKLEGQTKSWDHDCRRAKAAELETERLRTRCEQLLNIAKWLRSINTKGGHDE